MNQCFATLILQFMILVIDGQDSKVWITVLDIDGNQHDETNIPVRVGSNLILICKRNGNPNGKLEWQKSDFESRDFFTIQNSKHMVIDRTGGESRLSLSDIMFKQSGVFTCKTEANNANVVVHVYGIIQSFSAHVQVISVEDEVQGMTFQRKIPSLSSHPKLGCNFQVGKNGIRFVTIRWKGGTYSPSSRMYEIAESRDKNTGKIWSNLTIKITSKDIEQNIFGPYKCSFNVVPGTSENATVYLTIPPIIVRNQSSLIAHADHNFSLSCIVIAYPTVSAGNIEWKRNNQPIKFIGGEVLIPEYDHGGRITFANKTTQHDTLQFNPLAVSDRDLYTCTAKTTSGNASSVSFIRVKSFRSTLWPIIGILAEVIFLITVISIYERRRRKRKAKEEEIFVKSNPSIVKTEYTELHGNVRQRN